MPAFETKEDFLYLNIRVKTSAKKTEIREIDAETIYISLAAVPDKERANSELMEFLSDAFEVPKNSIFLVAGRHSTSKTIKIRNSCKVEKKLRIILGQEFC